MGQWSRAHGDTADPADDTDATIAPESMGERR